MLKLPVWQPPSASSNHAGIANAADSQKMKIGIIGSGHVGSALGGVWAKAGNEVMFSSRNLDNDKKLAADVGANARAGTPQEAAAFGQVILFAVPYSAFPELIKSLGNSLKGKVVINASNPFPQRDGEIANQAREKGAGLFDAHLLPGALVIRAFNAVPAARMASAQKIRERSACRSQATRRPSNSLRGWSERQGSNLSSSAGFDMVNI